MESEEIIYPLDGDDVIPVKAEEVVCFQTELKPPWYRKRTWMAVELKNRTFLASNRYEGSEIDNLLRSLLKKNKFVFIKQPESEIFPIIRGDLTILSGVRFSAIIKIGKYMDYVKYESNYDRVLCGKVVEPTAENYRKWKETQEDIWRIPS
jgi:hypothetical protein